jgi:flagellar biosynthesis GTPase FlhF
LDTTERVPPFREVIASDFALILCHNHVTPLPNKGAEMNLHKLSLVAAGLVVCGVISTHAQTIPPVTKPPAKPTELQKAFEELSNKLSAAARQTPEGKAAQEKLNAANKAVFDAQRERAKVVDEDPAVKAANEKLAAAEKAAAKARDEVRDARKAAEKKPEFKTADDKVKAAEEQRKLAQKNLDDVIKAKVMEELDEKIKAEQKAPPAPPKAEPPKVEPKKEEPKPAEEKKSNFGPRK